MFHKYWHYTFQPCSHRGKLSVLFSSMLSFHYFHWLLTLFIFTYFQSTVKAWQGLSHWKQGKRGREWKRGGGGGGGGGGLRRKNRLFSLQCPELWPGHVTWLQSKLRQPLLISEMANGSQMLCCHGTWAGVGVRPCFPLFAPRRNMERMGL